MSLPPLPESFGNYAIRGIAEVLPPEPVSWIPVTTGWRLLGAAILLWVIYQGYRQYRAWRRDRYRRLALRAFPRTEVARLSGQRWLDWLQSSTETPVFSERSRALLSDSQYRATPDVDRETLLRLARDCEAWIQQHRGAEP